MGSRITKNLSKFLFLLLCCCTHSWAQITYEGTASSAVNSDTGQTTLEITHTTTADTDIVFIAAGSRNETADIDISSIEDWVTTTEPFTAISRTNGAADPNEQLFEVWALVSPTAKTETITVTWDDTQDWHWIIMANYAGNDITSVAAATNIIQEVDNASSGTTTVFASGGTSGRGLVVFAGARGNDGTPASINASFVEIIDTDTGGVSGHNNDNSLFHAYLLDGAPAAPTVQWTDSDPNAGVMIELVLASAGSATVPLLHHQKNLRAH